MTIVGLLEKILNDIHQIGGVEASAVASRDGLLMYSTLPKKQHAETFVAMAATMLGAAETTSTELGKGVPERVVVESKDGKLIVTGAGPKALLITMTEHDAGLGLILVEVEKASEKIKKMLS